MFIGHFGLGFAAKRVAPRTSLGTLFLAAQFVDLLWPTLLLAGVERVRIAPGITRMVPLDFEHYPVSHSLLMAAVWGLLFAGLYAVARRYPRGAVVVGVLVASHWLLDLLVHRPDLPLLPVAGPRFGWGLWNAPAAAVALELAIFAAGVALYLRATRPLGRRGVLALWALVALLALIHVGNLLGPPPPSAEAIAWVGQAQWLLVLAGYAVDRVRTSDGSPAG